MTLETHSLAEGCCSALRPCHHQRYDPTTICAQCRNDIARLAERSAATPEAALSPVGPTAEAVLEALDRLQLKILQRDVEPRLDDKWGVICTRTADPDTNWPGELVSEHTTYAEARLAMMREALAQAGTAAPEAVSAGPSAEPGRAAFARWSSLDPQYQERIWESMTSDVRAFWVRQEDLLYRSDMDDSDKRRLVIIRGKRERYEPLSTEEVSFLYRVATSVLNRSEF